MTIMTKVWIENKLGSQMNNVQPLFAAWALNEASVLGRTSEQSKGKMSRGGFKGSFAGQSLEGRTIRGYFLVILHVQFKWPVQILILTWDMDYGLFHTWIRNAKYSRDWIQRLLIPLSLKRKSPKCPPKVFQITVLKMKTNMHLFSLLTSIMHCYYIN